MKRKRWDEEGYIWCENRDRDRGRWWWWCRWRVKSAKVNGGTEDMSVSHVMSMTLVALNEIRAQSQSPSSSSTASYDTAYLINER